MKEGGATKGGRQPRKKSAVSASLPARIGRSARALRGDDSLFRLTAELSTQIPWSADIDGRIIDVGLRFLELTGADPETLLDIGMWTHVHADDLAPTRDRWEIASGTNTPFQHELRFRMRDGGYRWFRMRGAPDLDDEGQALRWYGIAEDIHDWRLVEAALHWSEQHDALTRLLNRAAFIDAVNAAMRSARDAGEDLALLILDIDALAEVNNQHGADTGDRLLQQVATRISQSIDDGDLAARLGGDEFGLVVRCRGGERIEAVVENLVEKLVHPIPLDRGAAASRATIGAVLFRGFGTDAAELMRSAMLALREAKLHPNDRVRMFESGMRASLQRRSSMMAVARQALRQKRIVPYYQPKFSLDHRRIEGFEALLRIRGLRPGVLGPKFIAAAFDDPQLAIAITDRMLDLVARDMANWRAKGVQFGSIAVNASSGDLRGGHFPERIFQRISKAKLPPDCIEVEVTETVLLDHGSSDAEAALAQLSNAGIRIALDDFGTGFASLTHVQRFPVDVIKIDQSFVANIGKGHEEAAIVRAIVDLSRSLSIETVAEGVETADQARLLHEIGCDQVQGFLIAKAMPAADVPAFLESINGLGAAAAF